MNTIDQKNAVRRIHSCGNNYYKMLDVPHNATEAQILMSFKKMAKKVHPDKNFDPRATETFQALLKAKNVLMDSTMRKDFDQKLRCSYGETRWNRRGNSKRSGGSNGGSNGGLDARRNGGRFSLFKPQWTFIVLIIFVLMAYILSIPSYCLNSSEEVSSKVARPLT
ncbi:GL16684 [Drosophila persimilis]|uniref:GL16684 n=1 Tax=Drosophila persimilis TaxID=7234 RepID=B4HCU3_DROPE|nr:GL16684 [Drosophila persimilis]